MARSAVKPFSADWGWGLLAGTLFGLAAAMILVEPHWITPESKARLYVSIIGLVGAGLATAARNWFWRSGKPPQGGDSA